MKAPARFEWDFSKVPESEIFDCCHYEFAREASRELFDLAYKRHAIRMTHWSINQKEKKEIDAAVVKYGPADPIFQEDGFAKKARAKAKTGNAPRYAPPPPWQKLTALQKRYAQSVVRLLVTQKLYGDSITHTLQHIEKSFSAVRLIHGAMASMGIGTGSALVEHAIEAVREHFEAIKKQSEDIEKTWVEISKLMREGATVGETPGAQQDRIKHAADSANAEVDRLEKLLEDTRAKQRTTTFGTYSNGSYKETTTTLTDAELEKNAKVMEAMKLYQDALIEQQKAKKELAEMNEKLEKSGIADTLRREADGTRDALKMDEELWKGKEHIAAAIAEQDKKMQESRQKFEEIADPLKKYDDQLEAIALLQRSDFAMSAETAAAAIAHIHDEMAKVANTSLQNTMKEVFKPGDDALKEQERLAERGSEIWGHFGDDVSSAVSDAIVAGGGLRDAWNSILDDIERKMIKTFLNKEISGALNAMADAFGAGSGVGGFLASLAGTFGKAAGGGNIDGPTIVGENGPELFVPSGSGIVMNNDSTRANGVGGGPTRIAYIDARGADPAGLARVEAQLRALHYSIESRAISAVFDLNRRLSPAY